MEFTTLIALLVGIVGVLVLLKSLIGGSSNTNNNNNNNNKKPTDSASTTAADSILSQSYKPFPLIEKINASHNSRIFRFGLPKKTDTLGLPTGQHISLKAKTEYSEKVEYRSYTPISDNDDHGYFDLLVKIYPTGVMSRHLDNMQIGQTMDVRGPKGNYTYQQGKHDSLIMLAGGTGITPMYQILKAIAKNPSDLTRVFLFFANVTEDDILLRDELERLAADSRVSITFTLDKPTDSWKGEKGFISMDMMQRANVSPPSENTLVLVCGPPGMCKAMESNIDKLGYSSEQRFIF